MLKPDDYSQGIAFQGGTSKYSMSPHKPCKSHKDSSLLLINLHALSFLAFDHARQQPAA